MAVPVQTVSVIPAVIVAFEFEELCPTSVRAGQAQGEHRGFCSGVREAHGFGRGHHTCEALGSVRLGWSGSCKMRAFSYRPGNHLHNFRMRMPLNQRSERHHEVNVSVALEVPDVRSTAALQ